MLNLIQPSDHSKSRSSLKFRILNLEILCKYFQQCKDKISKFYIFMLAVFFIFHWSKNKLDYSCWNSISKSFFHRTVSNCSQASHFSCNIYKLHSFIVIFKRSVFSISLLLKFAWIFFYSTSVWRTTIWLFTNQILY